MAEKHEWGLGCWYETRGRFKVQLMNMSWHVDFPLLFKAEDGMAIATTLQGNYFLNGKHPRNDVVHKISSSEGDNIPLTTDEQISDLTWVIGDWYETRNGVKLKLEEIEFFTIAGCPMLFSDGTGNTSKYTYTGKYSVEGYNTPYDIIKKLPKEQE
jgi:hypothetical protein